MTTDDTRSRRSDLLLGPAVLVLTGLVVLPVGWTILRGAGGLGWFAADEVSTAVNTVVWVAGSVIGSLLIGLVLTALLHGRRGAGSWSALLLIPAASSMAVVAVAWRFLLAFRPDGRAQVGLVNEIVGLAGIAPVAWLTQEPLVNTVLLVAALVWAMAGVVAAVLLAALHRAEVPVDPADGWWTTLRRRILPAVRRPLLGVGAVVAVLAVRIHDLVRVATDGAFGTQVLSTESIDRSLVMGQTARGAAVGIALLLAAGPFAVALAWWSRREGALAPEASLGRHSRARRRAPRPRAALLGGAVALLALIPLLGVGLTALRPAADAAADGWWTLPVDPALTLDNLRTVLGNGPRGGMGTALVDSLAIAVPAVLLTIGLALITHDGLVVRGPATARRLRPVLVVLALVPPAVVLPAIALGLDAVGLHGSAVGPWLAHAALGLPLALLVIGRPDTGGAPSVPWDRVAAAAAIQFVLVWNDLLVATSTVGGTDRPMPTGVRLASLVAARGEEQHLVAAAAVIAMVVPVVVVLSMRTSLVGLIVGDGNAGPLVRDEPDHALVVDDPAPVDQRGGVVTSS